MSISTVSRLFVTLTLRSRLSLLMSKHPVSAVISLVQVFVSRGCYLRTIGLDFFTFTYIVIYVGAIAVLFLFVIMLLETRNPSSSSMRKETGSLLLFRRGRRFLTRMVPMFQRRDPFFDSSYTSLRWDLEEVRVLTVGQALGNHLYTTYLRDFLISAFLLLVSIVGSIQITLSRSTFEQKRKSQSIFQQMVRQEKKTIRF